MRLYPVIMCGGAGTRLWPASRPSRPKQFIPLAGNRSVFQETVLRVAPLAVDGGRILVVGGVSHRRAILDQLDDLGVEAQVLLEPEARDSAAAMAVAAAWTEAHDAGGVNIFVASDHHIPDGEEFRRAVMAGAEGAVRGRIVTLGVKPTEPSEAYGYIRPGGAGLAPVSVFVEKPSRRTAENYIQNGYLWNSGNFIASARVFLSELSHHAPGVAGAARAAITEAEAAPVAVLGAAFRQAPKISIDYALMEKTRVASVLPVDFRWSDLGAWDAIAATGEGEIGGHIFEDAEGCMARAPDGMIVAALGVRNLAIVAERDAVLVCDLKRAQDVKKVVERIRLSSPQHADFPLRDEESLADGAGRLRDWLRLRALPIWSSLGQDAAGGFAELLSLEGRRVPAERRARVQARQIYVFAQAGLMGWEGPWRPIVEHGLRYLDARFLRPDGRMRTLLADDGEAVDDDATVYDQAFLLLAWATAVRAGVADADLEAPAARVRDLLLAEALPNGAIIEAGDHPYQSNAHMHLLEAALAWAEVSDDPAWADWAQRLSCLARQVFIDPDSGRLREYFDSAWRPAAGDAGRLIEPGHQFEWAWLLARQGASRNDADALKDARRLYERGREGLDLRHNVAVDALNDDGGFRTRRARLWPQTEWLKAALLLAETADRGQREALLGDAAKAQRALWFYLTPEGLWRDKRLETGRFIDEPAPASSLYHIVSAFRQVVGSGVLGKGAESGALH
ncbi:mannose-1-phosphate guanylyltransferase [Brevundimonas naejangsanensis]|uniref:Mannose-1-phosphate guanylyltransferase n=1 Tax=Brevundimonas naejangsanensis TaxID=588932 RepID=A0A494RJU9_9CAUL|nr:AGE family epimerase/isomerase [Brevundimonas naejangsanensis]AYG94272.1 mannose-1-phosphate guanylyltransferase [Brevundimonas naejangsanensis]